MSRSKPTLPYRVLSQEAVVASSTGWAVVVGDSTIAHLGDNIPFSSWDANLDFRLERDFHVDRDLARELHVDANDSCCELIVTGSSSGGLTRGILFRQAIPAGRPTDVSVVITPSSKHLAKDWILTSGVYLSRDVESADELAPSVSGSRLWEMNERIRLEGGTARLPMYTVPFSITFAGDGFEHAEFHVEIAEESELEIESALTVYLNSEYPEFVKEVNTEGSAAETRLWSGIVRRVLASAILGGVIQDQVAGDSSTLAATVQRWARMIWPEASLSSLQKYATGNNSKFESQIESWLSRLNPKSARRS